MAAFRSVGQTPAGRLVNAEPIEPILGPGNRIPQIGCWYPYGQAGAVAEWDGQGWTGRRRDDPAVPEPPRWKHRPWVFLTHAWFWLIVVGWVIAAVSGIIGNNTTSQWWVWSAAIGMIFTLAGIVLLFPRHLRFGELSRLPLLIGVGLVSGVVGILLASTIEGSLEPKLHIPFAVDLWLSGFIEETCKILVPLLLLIFARKWFGDPRAGVFMVLLSGAVFGIGEGVAYMRSGSGTNSHLVQGLVRPFTEISHPLWASIAAAAIWLAAHRRGRVVTLTGFVGWFVASALHSIHDGLGATAAKGDSNEVTDQDMTMSEAITDGVVLNIFGIIVAVIAFLVLRHILREMVPPTAIATNAPHSRPQLKTWGVPADERKRWETEPVG